ncbi:MAG: hypothetical protein IPG50_26460 [Myxococcales bacterium]|nr:hypothetical protein [Myxococcales bacterium]
MRQRILRIALVVLIMGVVLFGPHIAWRLLPARTLAVVVVDKTVPFKKYREHAAIPWLLHAMKVRDKAGAFLDPARDYVGFDPESKKGHDLTAAHLDGADALVIADTYGVYVGDYEKPGDIAALERSPKIYGGFTGEEAAAIEAFAAQGHLIIGEFNTFASPTDDRVRARLEDVFGARWTKWVGRYWPKLEDENEVPRWVARVYERLEKKPFLFRGGGFVLVREDAEIIVLEEGKDLGPAVVEQRRTPAGAELGLPERGGFWFWMDIVEARGSEVLFEHVLDVTPTGKEKLDVHRVPARFPALVRKKSVYYLAGDFVDTALELGDPERAGLLPYRRRALGWGGGTSSDEAFFWGFYAPIVTQLFTSRLP